MTSITVGYPEGEETIIIMNHAHSIFMNCVPVTCEQLGADVLEKADILSKIHFSAKFYPLPSHADMVVVLWLYNCDFPFAWCSRRFFKDKSLGYH